MNLANTKSVSYYNNIGQIQGAYVREYPDICPSCGKGISAVPAYGFKGKWLQVVFRCPIVDCSRLFIAHYGESDNNVVHFLLRTELLPVVEDEEFPASITKVSPKFKTIYNQSKKAEEGGLEEICGLGYRKSLEFLVKDYLISKSAPKEIAVGAKCSATSMNSSALLNGLFSKI
ncbi:MAG: hypothetical protein AAB512_02470 [Patescibacteria group bacterium]